MSANTNFQRLYQSRSKELKVPRRKYSGVSSQSGSVQKYPSGISQGQEPVSFGKYTQRLANLNICGNNEFSQYLPSRVQKEQLGRSSRVIQNVGEKISVSGRPNKGSVDYSRRRGSFLDQRRSTRNTLVADPLKIYCSPQVKMALQQQESGDNKLPSNINFKRRYIRSMSGSKSSNSSTGSFMEKQAKRLNNLIMKNKLTKGSREAKNLTRHTYDDLQSRRLEGRNHSKGSVNGRFRTKNEVLIQEGSLLPLKFDKLDLDKAKKDPRKKIKFDSMDRGKNKDLINGRKTFPRINTGRKVEEALNDSINSRPSNRSLMSLDHNRNHMDTLSPKNREHSDKFSPILNDSSKTLKFYNSFDRVSHDQTHDISFSRSQVTPQMMKTPSKADKGAPTPPPQNPRREFIPPIEQIKLQTNQDKTQLRQSQKQPIPMPLQQNINHQPNPQTTALHPQQQPPQPPMLQHNQAPPHPQNPNPPIQHIIPPVIPMQNPPGPMPGPGPVPGPPMAPNMPPGPPQVIVNAPPALLPILPEGPPVAPPANPCEQTKMYLQFLTIRHQNQVNSICNQSNQTIKSLDTDVQKIHLQLKIVNNSLRAKDRHITDLKNQINAMANQMQRVESMKNDEIQRLANELNVLRGQGWGQMKASNLLKVDDRSILAKENSDLKGQIASFQILKHQDIKEFEYLNKRLVEQIEKLREKKEKAKQENKLLRKENKALVDTINYLDRENVNLKNINKFYKESFYPTGNDDANKTPPQNDINPGRDEDILAATLKYGSELDQKTGKMKNTLNSEDMLSPYFSKRVLVQKAEIQNNKILNAMAKDRNSKNFNFNSFVPLQNQGTAIDLQGTGHFGLDANQDSDNSKNTNDEKIYIFDSGIGASVKDLSDNAMLESEINYQLESEPRFERKFSNEKTPKMSISGIRGRFSTIVPNKVTSEIGSNRHTVRPDFQNDIYEEEIQKMKMEIERLTQENRMIMQNGEANNKIIIKEALDMLLKIQEMKNSSERERFIRERLDGSDSMRYLRANSQRSTHMRDSSDQDNMMIEIYRCKPPCLIPSP